MAVINCILYICSATWKQGGGGYGMDFNSILDCSCVRQYTRIFAQYCDLRAMHVEDHILVTHTKRVKKKKTEQKLVGYKAVFSKQKFPSGLLKGNKSSFCDSKFSRGVHAVVFMFHLQFCNVWFGSSTTLWVTRFGGFIY